MAAEYPGVYPYSRSDAQRHGELELYDSSFRENVACSRDVERAIRTFFQEGDEHLKAGCAEAVLERYGFKRLRFVLSNSLKEMGMPHLLSEEARKWCAAVYVPEDKQYSRYFAVDTAAPLLEEFIGQTRAAYQVLGLFGPEHCAGDRSRTDYQGKVLVLSPDTLKESCWSPENMLWYAHDGFGCSPTASGRSIRCTCLGDGEMTRWNRADFLGVLDEQYLPDWAEESLKELQEQEQGPVMGGMTM